MRAMFKVTLRSSENPNGAPFDREFVIAGSAAEAVKLAETEARNTYEEKMFASDVEFLGADSIEGR